MSHETRSSCIKVTSGLILTIKIYKILFFLDQNYVVQIWPFSKVCTNKAKHKWSISLAPNLTFNIQFCSHSLKYKQTEHDKERNSHITSYTITISFFFLLFSSICFFFCIFFFFYASIFFMLTCILSTISFERSNFLHVYSSRQAPTFETHTCDSDKKL